MAQKDLNVEMIKLSEIMPDQNQPRKFFNAERLNTLRESIERHGIMTPLIVTRFAETGKYLLVDGERRFRAAQEVGLKQVPVIVTEPKNGTERLIEQFHIQEQHERWTNVEKAMAIGKLAKEMGTELSDTCKLLGVPKALAANFISFASIVDQKAFERNEIPVWWAKEINNLKSLVKKIYNDNYEQEFTRDDAKAVENAVIERIKRGTMTRRGDVIKIKDTLKKDPDYVKPLLEDVKMSAEKMFLESKASSASHLRNVILHCGYASSRGARFLENPQGIPITNIEKNHMKRAISVLQDVIKLAE